MVPTVEHSALVSRERRSSWTVVKCPSWLKGSHGHKAMLHISMTSLNQRKPIGGAGNHRVPCIVSSVSGLAVLGVELQG